MSKLCNKYQKLKKQEDIAYLFKVGIFYLFLDEDAKKMNQELGLKCTHLNNDVLKCGFPIDSINKYANILKEKKIKFKIIDKEIIDEEENYLNNVKLKKVLNKIKTIDIEKINGLKALQMLNELRDILEQC